MSPVAQLAVAAISGAAFLISMLVIPFPESKADSSAGMTTTSRTSDSFFRTVDAPSTPLTK
ncbi:hypothetical protein [Cyanobium gracile]|uniref:hypothetical protein n=1 Tax=Cyanobium gracile TaxID=59930 RepID=UPI0012EA988D|nr:hypothetical protein [Cyanobium gracile]